MLVRGGPNGELHVVEKKVVSHVDGVPMATFADGGSERASPINDPQLKPFFESEIKGLSNEHAPRCDPARKVRSYDFGGN